MIILKRIIVTYDIIILNMNIFLRITMRFVSALDMFVLSFQSDGFFKVCQTLLSYNLHYLSIVIAGFEFVNAFRSVDFIFILKLMQHLLEIRISFIICDGVRCFIMMILANVYDILEVNKELDFSSHYWF